MNELVSLLVITGCLAVVMGSFGWLAARVRRRGTARDAFQVIVGTYDSLYHSSAQESHYEIKAQAERKSPLSSSDVPWRPAGELGARALSDTGRSRRRRSWRTPRRRR
ncbi:hypothetical protein [Streptomyces litchfieldiae]|uniref:Secreted protein n=1 Tax=Streptomyces litchfieldiae TaxID=3075543 RepID=A0ABU2MW33_9ACTN|nr:hypothetical protein [Streptomyces sp. DSM 44938]MDT0345860.1 hypothetical protein [Streptomyces sp. DSM 44938]